MRFYCTSTGPIGGLNCEVLLYSNWSHRWSQLQGSTVMGPLDRITRNGAQANEHYWIYVRTYRPVGFKMTLYVI